MSTINLEDLIPQDSTIVIGGKTYDLRKVNVEDEAWMRRVFGDHKQMEKVFSEMDFEKISKLIFRLLKDKSDFKPEEIQDYDDDGNIITKTITAPMKIMRSLSGSKEKLEAYYSLVECIGLSRPILEKLAEEELKKNETAQNIMKEMSPTGETSTTVSQASMATP